MGRLKIHEDFKAFLAYWNTILVLSECDQWNLLIAVRFLLCLFSSPLPLQAVPLSFLSVSCSGECESNCCRFLEARCLCVTHSPWALPWGTHSLEKNKKADLLSLSFSSLLMIPSLSFWEDLSSPLTPVRRGRLKQLKVSSISRLAKESSRGLLGNAKTGTSVFSAFRRQIPAPFPSSFIL